MHSLDISSGLGRLADKEAKDNVRGDRECYPIDYREIQAWDQDLQKDLVALAPEAYRDAFSKWVRDKAIPWYPNVVGERTKASPDALEGDHHFCSLTGFCRKPAILSLEPASAATMGHPLVDHPS